MNKAQGRLYTESMQHPRALFALIVPSVNIGFSTIIGVIVTFVLIVLPLSEMLLFPINVPVKI